MLLLVIFLLDQFLVLENCFSQQELTIFLVYFPYLLFLSGTLTCNIFRRLRLSLCLFLLLAIFLIF